MLANDKIIDQYRLKLVKSFRRKNHLFLYALALLAIVSHVFFLYSIRTTDSDGFMINQSGKQRFLSQAVSFLSLQFINSKNEPARHENIRQKLVETINEMKANHDFLEHDKSSILALYHSNFIDSIYYNAPVFLNNQVHRFLDEAYYVSEAEGDDVSYSNPHLIYIIESSAGLLKDLNLITKQYEIENKDEIDSFYYNRIYFLIFSLLLYASVGVFYFRPMTKQIDSNLSELSKKEKEIEEINDKQISTIIDAQEKERQRIATDLHDGLIQTLTTISYKINNAIEMRHDDSDIGNIKGISFLIDEAIDETRNIAYSIIPPLLKEFGLIPSLNSLCVQFKNNFGLTVTLQVYELNNRLANNLELTLYRITQEALNNVVKYANANNVWIQLIRHSASIVLIIEDDGKGFDATSKPNFKGLGLFNIEERTKAFGGNVSINSAPNQGTEIMVEIPLV